MTFIDNLTRKKYVSFDSSPLSRSLTLIDLTLLGIGSTVGVGFYILAGQVARDTAGPAVTISFLIAAVASVFAGLCYAEFGARVPKAGSAYIYSYVCVGEFIAFVIGWNLLLEYIIGTASVARGFSAYFDDLVNHKMSAAFNRTMHMDVNTLGEYPDFFAFGVVLLLTGILILGVKESSTLNNIFTGLNVFVIIYVIIAGSTLADTDNWHLSQADVLNESICENQSEDWGTGGFAPFGFSGIIHGAATCFFGFIGFDVIATTGEEAIKPERNLPLAISISLLCVFVSYFGMSTILTLAVPYCMEDPDAPLIELFNGVDMDVSKWIVSIGAVFGFSASLIGAMFPMPRIVYAMADDGLIFRPLSKVNKRFKTPVIATVCTGLLAGIMALLFTLDTLVDMMSIGTLMAYTIVAVCVMLLRYAPDNDAEGVVFNKSTEGKLEVKSNVIRYSWKDYGKQLFNSSGLKEPTDLSSSLVNFTTLSFAFFCFLLDLFLTLFGDKLSDADPGIISLICVFFVLTFCNLVVIACQPVSRKRLTFQVPFVPWIPALSTFINLYLMCNLSGATWIRFAVWMVIGFLIYFLYGYRRSSAGMKLRGEVPPSSNQRIINFNNIGSIFETDSDEDLENF
ncbi:Cationic amino acid transporter 2 [Armadillidium nasatum]|uniref:Cationic amino acid transporter 2 n=1 Tax=Armadillidium nasatum TaxID=96803 RepID=A0A5N5TPI8_9CRUS|nr:Cationic amino acid transporter 2 [Armadillidium nasatum]